MTGHDSVVALWWRFGGALVEKLITSTIALQLGFKR